MKKIGIDFKQTSTKRGLVRLIVFTVGLVMAWQGKDVSQLLLFGVGINGALGFAVKD